MVCRLFGLKGLESVVPAFLLMLGCFAVAAGNVLTAQTACQAPGVVQRGAD